MRAHTAASERSKAEGAPLLPPPPPFSGDDDAASPADVDDDAALEELPTGNEGGKAPLVALAFEPFAEGANCGKL